MMPAIMVEFSSHEYISGENLAKLLPRRERSASASRNAWRLACRSGSTV
jgi:hypothetical protein